jgi:hypothetical protein
LSRTVTEPMLPKARGPLSACLLAHLHHPPHELPKLPTVVGNVRRDEDAMLALYLAYELHYRGFAGVDERWEWEPSLIRERTRLERAFERGLRAAIVVGDLTPEQVTDELRELTTGDGPSLSRWFAEHGSLGHMREFAVHRSAYQLKEADPYTWAIPRLRGRAKAALVAIQHGEYGDGQPELMHATLFADTMRALGLDPTYGAYLDCIPAVTLATVNVMSLFGLHRCWRGALVGHLALFEMSSVAPMQRYADTLRRLGVEDGAPFYDTHVEADVIHEQIALYDMAGALALDEPALAHDIVFGARVLERLEADFSEHLLSSWSAGRSSLLPC